jgi:hypothetical protein
VKVSRENISFTILGSQKSSEAKAIQPFQ